MKKPFSELPDDLCVRAQIDTGENVRVIVEQFNERFGVVTGKRRAIELVRVLSAPPEDLGPPTLSSFELSAVWAVAVAVGLALGFVVGLAL